MYFAEGFISLAISFFSGVIFFNVFLYRVKITWIGHASIYFDLFKLKTVRSDPL